MDMEYWSTFTETTFHNNATTIWKNHDYYKSK